MYLAWKAMPLQISMQERTTRFYIEATSLHTRFSSAFIPNDNLHFLRLHQ